MVDTSARVKAKDSSGDVRSTDLSNIFVTIFLIGSFFVATPLFLPIFGENSPFRWLTTLLPIALMILFMKIGRHRVEQQGTVELEQIADSLYFMGFMFTLVALLVALLHIRNPIDMGAITSRFGVAMLTTLAGLLLKVMLTQFKQEGGITQRQAQNNLLRATRRFTRALDSSSASVEKSVNDAAAKALEITEKSISEITEYSMSAQKAMATNTKSGLDLMAKKSQSDMDTLFGSATSNVDALSGQAQTVIEMLAEHGKESQNQLVSDAGMIASKLDDMTSKSAVATSEHISGLNSHLGTLQESIDNVQTRIDALADTLDSSVQKHRSLLGPLDRFSTNLADNNDRLSSLHGTLTSFTVTGNTLSDGVERLEGAIKRLENSLGNSARVNSFFNLEAEESSSAQYVDELDSTGRTQGVHGDTDVESSERD